jgi:hypothetical protein
MADSNERLVYIDEFGGTACVESRGAIKVGNETHDALAVLSRDLQLALDCIDLWGRVPIPVAEAIVRSAKPALAYMIAIGAVHGARKDLVH